MKPGTDLPAGGRGGGVESWLLRLVFLVAMAFTLVGLIETAFILYDLRTGAVSISRAPDLGFGIRSWTV